MKYQYVSIGNGLYARTKTQPSVMEKYRLLQATCEHAQRDPRGTCYKCFQRESKPADGGQN